MPSQQEFNRLQQKFFLVQAENEQLKKEQLDFMNAVDQKIDEIEATNSFWKYFKYVTLVIEMIQTIKEFRDKKNKGN